MRSLKNSLDYRFYDFVKIFQKRSWELQQFTLKIRTMAHNQSAKETYYEVTPVKYVPKGNLTG